MAFGLPAFLIIVGMVFGFIGFVLLMLVIAFQFQKIAAEKGYSSQKWFWLCFLLGLPGWLMVVALPDMKLQKLLRANPSSLSTPSATVSEVLKAPKVPQTPVAQQENTSAPVHAEPHQSAAPTVAPQIPISADSDNPSEDEVEALIAEAARRAGRTIK